MAIYAIGDVQGCLDELQRLLDHIHFDPASDRLWLAGDLVNRGPHSLQTLRFVRNLGEAAHTVLGNHDLHLLAASHDPEYASHKDTLRPVLDAPDRDGLLDWLRRQPLLIHDAELKYTLVHAGLPPQWSIEQARAHAHELEQVLRSDDYVEFLFHMYGNKPHYWSDQLSGWDRLRFITNAFTRLRYCDEDGRMALKYKLAPGSQPKRYRPWFEIVNRCSRDDRILFGHWSTLGDYPTTRHNVYPLDTGCLWGGRLTALEIDHPDNPRRHQIPCRGIPPLRDD